MELYLITFCRRGFSESDIRLIMATLRRDLQSIGVEVRDKPEYERRFTVDEVELEKCIKGDLEYANPNALRRDVDSVSAVIRLRRGKVPKDLEQATAIFATSNNPLSRAGNAFYSQDLGGGGVSCPGVYLGVASDEPSLVEATVGAARVAAKAYDCRLLCRHQPK